MSKAFLLRTEKDDKFRTIKLEFREPGFSNDLEKFYVGGASGNIHIPNEEFVSNMISTELSSFGPTKGTTAALATTHVVGTFAFNSDLNRIIYKATEEASITVATVSDILAKEQISVAIVSDNIDANDGSVSFVEFTRPVKMIFVDGILCTNNAASAKRYTFDTATKTLKVFGAVDGSIVSYF